MRVYRATYKDRDGRIGRKKRRGRLRSNRCSVGPSTARRLSARLRVRDDRAGNIEIAGF